MYRKSNNKIDVEIRDKTVNDSWYFVSFFK